MTHALGLILAERVGLLELVDQEHNAGLAQQLRGEEAQTVAVRTLAQDLLELHGLCAGAGSPVTCRAARRATRVAWPRRETTEGAAGRPGSGRSSSAASSPAWATEDLPVPEGPKIASIRTEASPPVAFPCMAMKACQSCSTRASRPKNRRASSSTPPRVSPRSLLRYHAASPPPRSRCRAPPRASRAPRSSTPPLPTSPPPLISGPSPPPPPTPLYSLLTPTPAPHLSYPTPPPPTPTHTHPPHLHPPSTPTTLHPTPPHRVGVGQIRHDGVTNLSLHRDGCVTPVQYIVYVIRKVMNHGPQRTPERR